MLERLWIKNIFILIAPLWYHQSLLTTCKIVKTSAVRFTFSSLNSFRRVSQYLLLDEHMKMLNVSFLCIKRCTHISLMMIIDILLQVSFLKLRFQSFFFLFLFFSESFSSAIFFLHFYCNDIKLARNVMKARRIGDRTSKCKLVEIISVWILSNFSRSDSKGGKIFL